MGTTTFTGIRGSGGNWTVTINGLTTSAFNTIIFTATDSSLRANKSLDTLHIKYDPTMTDSIGPTIAQTSGPTSGNTISDPLVTIVDTVSDPSGVDTVYWKLNNGLTKLLAKVSGKYSLTDSVKRENLDTIVVTAVDASSRHNRSTQTIILNYIIAPKITTQPASQAVCSGGQGIFTVAATGTAPLSYQWRTGASSFINISGATTPLCTLKNVTATTILSCVVSNQAATNTASTLCTLTVATAPTITGPTAQTTCTGVSKTMTIAASGATDYQWYGGTAGSETSISGATSTSYATSTAGSYYCVIAYGGGCSAKSSSATLTVNTPPAITGPTNQTTCSGTNATLTVTASGTNTYQWYSGTPNTGTAIPSATSASYATSTAGSYYCVVTGNSGCSATSAAATVTVNSPTISNPNATGICSGSGGATMTVTASSGAVLQWYRGTPTGTHTALTANTYYSGVAAATLTFNNGNSTMQDNYYCVATSSGCSTTSGTASLTVYNPPTITQQPTDQTVCPGSSGTFTVTASSGTTGYQWCQEGSQGSTIVLQGATTASYSTSNTGYYWCNVNYGSGCSPVSTNHVELSNNKPSPLPYISNTSWNAGDSSGLLWVEIDDPGDGTTVFCSITNNIDFLYNQSNTPIAFNGQNAVHIVVGDLMHPVSASQITVTCTRVNGNGCVSDPTTWINPAWTGHH